MDTWLGCSMVVSVGLDAGVSEVGGMFRLGCTANTHFTCTGYVHIREHTNIFDLTMMTHGTPGANKSLSFRSYDILVNVWTNSNAKTLGVAKGNIPRSHSHATHTMLTVCFGCAGVVDSVYFVRQSVDGLAS